MIALLPLSLLHKKIKLRFFVLSLISIILFFVIPGITNIYPTWAPFGSINDQSIVGFSDVADRLEGNGYSVERYVNPIDTFNDQNPKSALTFFADSFPENEDILWRRYSENLPTFLIGDFGFSDILPGYTGCKYLDYNSSFHSIAHVAVNGQFNGKEYVSVVPRPINFLEEGGIIPLLAPKNPSSEICADRYYELPTPISTPIAVKKGSLVFIADEFMLRNNFTRQYPQNLDLLPDILNQFYPEVDSLIVYEWNLNYMPVNKEGLQVVIEKNEIGGSIVLFISLLLLLVFIGGLGTGIFGGDTLIPSFQNKLARRLERLHTKRIPAVPLSAEETLLLREHFMFRQSGADYFKRVALETLKFIHEEGLEPIVPQNLLLSLQDLAAYRRSPDVAWEILGKVRYILDIIEENPLFIQGFMSQRDEDREISIFDLPTFSERSSIAFDTTPDYFDIPIEKEGQK